MIKPVRAIAPLLALAVLTFAGTHAAEKKEPVKRHEQLVESYIEKSGARKILESFPEQLERMLAQKQQASENPEEVKEISALFSGSFDKKSLAEELSGHILKNTDPGDVEKFIQWFESPLAKKISGEKNRAADKAEESEISGHMADLQKNPLPKARADIIRELEKATRETEFAVETSTEILAGMMSAFNNAFPEEKKMVQAEIEARIESVASTLREQMGKQIIDALAYAYRNLTDEQLKEYTAFYKTGIGKKEVAARGNGISHSLNQCFSNLEKKITIYLKEKNRAGEKK